MLAVTGANGFIGSAFVWKLNNEGITDILCVDSTSLEERPLPLHRRQYTDFVSHEKFFDILRDSSSKIRAIFHMGACSDTTETNEIFLEKNNTQYTNQLFQECTRLYIPFFYASSAAVYGNGEKGFDDRSDPKEFQPLNLYGLSKLKSDIWISDQLVSPPRWYGFRFFNVYGPNEYHKGSMRSLVHKAYEQILETGQLKLFKSYHPDFEDGKQMRDFVYVKDIVDWMWFIYKNSQIKSGIYNMGFGRARTWLDLASGVFDALDMELKIDWIEMPESIKGQYQYFTEARMKRLFQQGLPTPQWTLHEAISDYVRNYLRGDNAYL